MGAQLDWQGMAWMGKWRGKGSGRLIVGHERKRNEKVWGLKEMWKCRRNFEEEDGGDLEEKGFVG